MAQPHNLKVLEISGPGEGQQSDMPGVPDQTPNQRRETAQKFKRFLRLLITSDPMTASVNGSAAFFALCRPRAPASLPSRFLGALLEPIYQPKPIASHDCQHHRQHSTLQGQDTSGQPNLPRSQVMSNSPERRLVLFTWCLICCPVAAGRLPNDPRGPEPRAAVSALAMLIPGCCCKRIFLSVQPTLVVVPGHLTARCTLASLLPHRFV